MHRFHGPRQHAEFLRIWCCKEAFVKAIGTGLSIPVNLQQIDTPMSGGESAIRMAAWNEPHSRNWLLRPLPTGITGLHAALCAACDEWQISRFDCRASQWMWQPDPARD